MEEQRSGGLDRGVKAELGELVSYTKDAVVSRILLRNDAGNITLFAFDQGQELSKHTAPFDALVQVLEGQGRVTIEETPHDLKAGEIIIMPAHVPHAVAAPQRFKMLLVMLRG